MRLLSQLVAGMMLCDVPSPALVVDCTTARQRLASAEALDAALAAADGDRLRDLVYVHATVLEGRDPAYGAVGSTTAAGQPGDAAVVLAQLDATSAQVGGSGAFVGLGLNNHFTGGYYWGRSSGPGAAMPAPGVDLWDGGAPLLQLRRVGNSNDGKRSEWCEFLTPGDMLQIVPGSLPLALESFDVLVGVTRDGDRGVPPGAEPVVEQLWTRQGPTSASWCREWADAGS